MIKQAQRYSYWCQLLRERGITEKPPANIAYVMLPGEYVLTEKDREHAKELIDKHGWQV